MGKTVNHYDVIIIGLGAVGSAALHSLALKGVSVLGIDRFHPPHSFGSSHGETRVTRLANGEGSEYTRLALRSRKLWKDLETESGERLLTEKGALIFGVPGQETSHCETKNFLFETLNQAESNQIAHSYLSAGEISKRFPQFKLTGEEVGYYEPSAGFLFPEKCIRVQLDSAAKKGAKKLFDTIVYDIDFRSDPVHVHTSNGVFTCGKLIVSSGAWLSKLFPEFQDRFTIYRQIAVWFKLKGAVSDYDEDRFPTFKWKFSEGDVTGIYGFPVLDSLNPCIKIGIEDYSRKIDVDDHDCNVDDHAVREFYEKYIKNRIPGVSSEYIKASACLYTVTKDWKFILDFHPRNENIIIASPCSGHGFKHSTAVGEILANMSMNDPRPMDLRHFMFSRLSR